VIAAAACADAARPQADPSPWAGAPGGLFGFRLNRPAAAETRLERDGDVFTALLSASSADDWSARIGGGSFSVRRTGRGWVVGKIETAARVAGDHVIVFDDGSAYEFTEAAIARGAETVGDGAILSPMPGKVILVSSAVGESVRKGQPLLTLEAMKMEHVLTAPFDGVVASLDAREGDQVAEGVVLIRLEKPA
jgi:propionyl-CoA carboxylase alpha chain/3-methylcrotonyl-CoA carboxylase alpha subunit